MSEFVIYTDSACDIPPQLLKEWGVPYSYDDSAQRAVLQL